MTVYLLSLLVKFTEQLVTVAKNHSDVPFEKYNEAVLLHKEVLSNYTKLKNKNGIN
jgi:hypothetical protein